MNIEYRKAMPDEVKRVCYVVLHTDFLCRLYSSSGVIRNTYERLKGI